MSIETLGGTASASPAPVNPSPSAPPNDRTVPTESLKTHVSPWVQLCREFLACHRRPVNVAVHAVTTPLAMLGLLCLTNMLSPWVSLGLIAVYSIALTAWIPKTTWFATVTALVGLLAASLVLPASWGVGGALFVLGYVGQEAVHWLADEPTMQSTYSDSTGWVGHLIWHTLLLLPLILVTCGRRRQSPVRLLVSRKAVLITKLSLSRQQSDLQAICDWVNRKYPSMAQSTHWWQSDLEDGAGQAFDRLSHDELLIKMIRRFHGTGYVVRPVLGMNELYVTGPPKATSSDTVFYMPHVDGPWSVFPGARLYRCMLAASPNTEVTTHFPMSGTDYDEPEGYRLESGDAVAFDFNRELHYITRHPDPSRTQPRVNLKLHFVAYPKRFAWYGGLLDHLTTQYDIKARNLFLQTINPNGRWSKVKALWVLAWTKIFELVVRFAGWTNLAYVAAIAATSVAAGDWRIFAAGTSFVHYLIYIGTYIERDPVAFGDFKRNAVFFKTIALATLFGCYAPYARESFGSLACVVGGFGLAAYSTWILGVNRTYFSAELGLDPPARIERFPYGWIPHPMILGAMIGMAGMLLSPGFRALFSPLVIAHLVAYTAILIQEQFATPKPLEQSHLRR